MMTTLRRIELMGLLVAIGSLAIVFSAPAESASDEADASAQPAAVEDDMHEFMEYVFQPTYVRLQASLAASPADRNAWKAVKSDSLILAESANLLLHRHPTEHADLWDDHALAVRQQGGELYQAAKQSDFDLTKKQFGAVLTQCNACHNDFAEGEHQLAP